jgi:hypothetical protein
MRRAALLVGKGKHQNATPRILVKKEIIGVFKTLHSFPASL